MRPPAARQRSETDRGVVAVEFALVLPLLVLLIVLTAFAGSVYLDQLHLQAAAREGARAGSLDPALACPAAADALTGNPVGALTCTPVRTCATHGTSEVHLRADQTRAYPLVGDRNLTLRARSSYRCTGAGS